MKKKYIIALGIFLLLIIITFLGFMLFNKKIILNGPKHITLALGEDYIEYGALIKDKKDNPHNLIIDTWELNLKKVGTYKIKYQYTVKNKTYNTYRKVTITDQNPAIITLTSGEEYTVYEGDEYNDPGYKIIKNNEIINAEAKISGKVDINKTGNYEITYTYQDGQKKIKATRIVKVIPKTKGYINLKGENIIYLAVKDTYDEPGFNAYHYEFKELNEKVKIEGRVNVNTPGTYYLKYTLTESNNEVIKTRTIIVYDNEKPKLILNGESEINLNIGSKYQELGAIATDNLDGDISSLIKIEGYINTNKKGIYYLTYTITDKHDNVASALRIIKVE